MTRIDQHLPCLGPKGFYRLAYSFWPKSESGGNEVRPLLCIHGLTRNGRDFDALAERLSARRAVLCPDMPGRGRSDWFADKADYAYPTYLGTAATLIARLSAEAAGDEGIDYVGTSMGGIIGMLLAAQPNSPIRRLVLNDIGPFIPKASLRRIGDYVGRDPHFDDLDALETYLRRIHGSFGNLSPAQWRHMAETSAREVEGEGRLALAYDPGIAAAFTAEMEDVDLWAYYDRIACPTLVVRGAQSDLLLPETAEEMTRRGPRADLYEVAEAGHAPALLAEDQIARIEAFLAA